MTTTIYEYEYLFGRVHSHKLMCSKHLDGYDGVGNAAYRNHVSIFPKVYLICHEYPVIHDYITHKPTTKVIPSLVRRHQFSKEFPRRTACLTTMHPGFGR